MTKIIAVNASPRKGWNTDTLITEASKGAEKEADYLGVETGYNADKLNKIGYTTTPAKNVHAPIINEMLLSIECEVVHTVTVGSHTQITGEVKNILADESILNDKDRILLEKLNPIIYDEEQFRYLSIGEKVADAFKTGMNLKKELNGEINHD